MARATLIVASVVSIVTPSASSADVIRVPADYASLQAAINAAKSSDIILVSPGSYSSAEVIGKGVTIVADGGGGYVGKRLFVDAVPEGETVVVDGFFFDAFLQQSPGLVASDNDGTLRFSRCKFWGDDDGNEHGALITNCASVSFVDCVFRASVFDNGPGSGSGGDGIRTSNSSVNAYNCEVRGQFGSDEYDDGFNSGRGGHGGSGIFINDGVLHVQGCDLIAGGGGAGAGGGPGGTGGSGIIQYTGGALVTWADNSYLTGEGGCTFISGTCFNAPSGSPVTLLGGSWTQLEAEGRSLSADTAVREGDKVTVAIDGQRGDTVLLFAAAKGGHAVMPEHLGTWLLGDPLLLTCIPVGVIPPVGTIQLEIPLAEIGPGIDGVDVHLQATYADGSSVILGPSVVSTLLDSSF